MSGLIVWIDDDYELIGTLVQRLKECGYTILPLRTVEDSIAELKHILSCRLLILDILIPSGKVDKLEVNNQYLGINLLEQLQNKHGFDKPVVVCSVVTKKDVINKAEALADVVLYKPDTTATFLKEVVEKLLSGQDVKSFVERSYQ